MPAMVVPAAKKQGPAAAYGAPKNALARFSPAAMGALISETGILAFLITMPERLSGRRPARTVKCRRATKRPKVKAAHDIGTTARGGSGSRILLNERVEIKNSTRNPSGTCAPSQAPAAPYPYS